MIENLKKLAKRGMYSLRTRMIVVVLLGAMLGILVYISTRFLAAAVVESYWATDEARRRREEQYVIDLQRYIDENDISSADTEKITGWMRQNRYAYIMLYMDDSLFFSGGIYDNDMGDLPLVPGVTIEYPSLEEIKEYAQNNDLHTLRAKDGTIFARVSDFSEYFYYDTVNVISLITAFVTLSLVMMIYFSGLTRRIATLSRDVTIVSEVNMNHSIHTEGNDELATLTQNVDKMRSSIIENIEKEKRALDANAELITSMSHDIRTPLTVLLGYIDLMKNRAANDEIMAGYVRASESTALRLKELSDDMFRYFLVFGNRDVEVNLANYDARTLIEQLFSEHMLLLGESGYKLDEGKSDEFPEGLMIHTDAPGAMRIVDNLFSNIYKYADNSASIEFSLRHDEKRIYVEIKNKIKITADRRQSTGIGLKTCARIAEAADIVFEYSSSDGYYSSCLGFKIAGVENA